MKSDIRIIKHVGTISSGEGNYQKELNIVSINEGAFCYDLREWSLDHSSFRNGISLKNEEAAELLALLKECYKGEGEDLLQEKHSEKTGPVLPIQLDLAIPQKDDNNENTDEKLYAFLKSKRIRYIDKRAKGGALWIIGGHELDSIIMECAGLGFKFYYSEKGGRISKGKPGWYYQGKR